MLKYCIVLLFIVFRFYNGNAQSITGSLEGVVVDATSNEPMPFSSVAIYQKHNNKDSLIAGVETTLEGKFRIDNLPKKSLILRISFVGYQTLEQLISLTKDSQNLGKLILKIDSKLLEEVKVVGEKSAIEITPEKRIFNVGKSLTSIGGTAESLLRNVPSLTIDESGSASLRNMAATIYINGKPTQLTLAQIPANQIETVEVISNPSAKYDASTSGGIVNLVLKQNRDEGYNGLISAGIGNNSRYDATVNLDWKKGKWNLTGLYSLNATKNPLPGYVHRQNKDADGSITSYFNQDTHISLNNRFQSGRLAAEYQLNSDNIFSLAATHIAGSFNTLSNQNYNYNDVSGNTTSFGSRTTIPANDYTNSGLEVDWRHKFSKKGEELHIIGSITHNRISNAGDWYTTAFDIDASDTIAQSGYPIQNQIGGRIIGNQILGQLDYTHPINSSSKLEFGLRSYTYQRDQKYYFYEVISDIPVLLQDYSQDAKITETVNGAYALYTKQLSQKLGMQSGIRMEQSSLRGFSNFDGTTFGYNYPSKTGQNIFQSFFPSFSLDKKINETSEWNLSLSRKVGRPNFRHVFVGIQANDRQNITIGNPKVRPEFVNTAELNYNKSWDLAGGASAQWLASAYYIYEDHTIKPLVQPLATDSTILVTTFQNVKADIRYGIDNTLTYTVGSLSILANLNTYQVILQSVNFTNSLLGYNCKLNLTYKFSKGFSTQISAQRRSKNPSLQGYQSAVNGVDFALRKGFWQNRGSFIFSINDVFNSRRFLSYYDQPTVFQTSMNRREIRYFKFTAQLPLSRSTSGKAKLRKVENPDIDFSN